MQHCVACSTALSAVFCMQRRSIFTHTNKTDSKYSFFNFRPELWNVSTQGQPNISYLLKTFSNHSCKFWFCARLCKCLQNRTEQKQIIPISLPRGNRWKNWWTLNLSHTPTSTVQLNTKFSWSRITEIVNQVLAQVTIICMFS